MNKLEKRVVFAFLQEFFSKWEFVSEKHFGTITVPTPMAVRLEKTSTGNAENFLHPCRRLWRHSTNTPLTTNLQTMFPKLVGRFWRQSPTLTSVVTGGGACNQRSRVVRSYFYQVMTSHLAMEDYRDLQADIVTSQWRERHVNELFTRVTRVWRHRSKWSFTSARAWLESAWVHYIFEHAIQKCISLILWTRESFLVLSSAYCIVLVFS